ncbi:vomeronasal type-2 receptor 26-like [Rhinophrynus dorsalis]
MAGENNLRRQGCVLDSSNKPLSYSRDGDLIIGGILQIFLMSITEQHDFTELSDHIVCAGPSFFYLRHLLAFIYAIEEINNSTEILTNITLGYHVYDACTSEVVALMSTLSILSQKEDPAPNFICQRRQKTVGFIGHLLSSTTYAIAELTQLYGYPQISYGALDPMFNNRLTFPYLYRTVANEYSQFKAIIKLLTHFEWTWVGIIASDDNSNKQASVELSKELKRNGICVSFLAIIARERETNIESVIKAINLIKKSSASVIILYCSADHFLSMISKYHPVSGKLWISTVTLSIITEYDFKTYFHAFNGSLVISVHKGGIPNFKNFLHQVIWHKIPENIFVHYFWNLNFGCPNVSVYGEYYQNCSEENKWKDVLSWDESNSYRITHNIYTAVYALAHALHEMHSATNLLAPSYEDLSVKMRLKLNYYLKNVHLKTVSGEEVHFNENGHIPGKFDILNWIIYSNGTINKIHIGSFLASADSQFVINDSAIVWGPSFKQAPTSMCTEPCSFGHRRAHQSDMENCVNCPEDQWSNPTRDTCIQRSIDFLSYNHIVGATLSCFASIFVVITSVVLLIFVRLRSTPIVRANNRNLSYTLLVSLILSFFCSFLFIGHPAEGTCLLRQVAFGFIFSVAISSVLGKTITVVVAFNATKPSSKLRKWVGSKTSIGIVLVFSLGELIICIVWLIYAPPFLEIDTKTIPGLMILQCNEGSILAFYMVVSYIGLLALFSFILAFTVRKLPDCFNDAQYITFSMLVFCSVWVSFIPAYLSSKGKYVVAVEVFTILASTAGLLICIFAPKCYIMLLKPEHNTKRHLKG